jgi:hypothetical protein
MSAAGEGEYYQAFSIVHDGDVAVDDPVVQGTVYNFFRAYTITHEHIYIFTYSHAINIYLFPFLISVLCSHCRLLIPSVL